MLYSNVKNADGTCHYVPVTLSEDLKQSLINGASSDECSSLALMDDDQSGNYEPLLDLYRTDFERVLYGVLTGEPVLTTYGVRYYRTVLQWLVKGRIDWRYNHPMFRMSQTEIDDLDKRYADPNPVFESEGERNKHYLEGISFNLARIYNLDLDIDDNCRIAESAIQCIQQLTEEIIKVNPLRLDQSFMDRLLNYKNRVVASFLYVEGAYVTNEYY